jgi:hypothetical protein
MNEPVDRRRGGDRRKSPVRGPDRRQRDVPVTVDRRSGKDRRATERRDGPDRRQPDARSDEP